jgi:transcriptional regulator NrdR family protein
MICPRCQSDESKVIESIIKNGTRIRKRICKQCNLVYVTTEIIEGFYLYNKQTMHSIYKALESSLF